MELISQDRTPCFDREEFLDRCFGDTEMALELLDMFSDSANANLKSIEEAVATRDRAKLTSIAHAIKGVAGNLSAKALLKYASSIDRDYRDLNCDLDSLLNCVSSMQSEVKRCLEAVPVFRKSISTESSTSSAR